MSVQREIERELQNLYPGENGKLTGKLGYFVKGAFRVYVVKKPSMFYVRFEGGSMVEAKHDGKVKALSGLPVDLAVDERGVFHITGINSDEENAAAEIYGTGIYVPDHTHALSDMDWISVKDASLGKILYGNGTDYEAVDLSSYAITHAAIIEDSGVLLKTGVQTYLAFNVNQNGSGAPTATDDSSLNYLEGLSWWLDEATGDIYDCIEDSIGAAVWKIRGTEIDIGAVIGSIVVEDNEVVTEDNEVVWEL